MDELLKCEDNPLYLLHKEKESAQKKNEEHQDNRPITFDSDKQSTPDHELQTSPLSLSPVMWFYPPHLCHRIDVTGPNFRNIPDDEAAACSQRAAKSDPNEDVKM